MKSPRFACLVLLLGLAPFPGYMKEYTVSPAGADEVVFRPTDKVYPREPQIVMGKRAASEFDFVRYKVARLADVAQIYADFSKKEVRVPRNLVDRSEGIASEGAAQARYLIFSYDQQLPDVGVDIVPLGPNVVAFRAGKSYAERTQVLPATPEQAATAAAAMSEDRFWQLIESVGRSGRGGPEESFAMAAALQAMLTKLRPEEILGFQLRLNERMTESYRWDLWAIAYIVNGGASDDGFEYFRAWLIAQGREYYQAALKDPVRAADRAGKHQRNESEQLLVAAIEAYRTKIDQLPPALPFRRAAGPAGKQWNEEDLPKLYPELVKRFH